MSLNSPTVGSKGLWELNEPFNSLLPVNTALTCTAISNYPQLYSMGVDVYETYYRPYGLSNELYKEHMGGEGRIVFLKTDAGRSFSFPLHYLVSYPIGTGVNYVSMGLGIRLGALPVNTNLEMMIEQIREVCNLNVGVEIHIEKLALSEITIIDNASHDRLVKARAAKKKQATPALEKVQKLIETDAAKSEKLRLAEEKVIELVQEVARLKAQRP